MMSVPSTITLSDNTNIASTGYWHITDSTDSLSVASVTVHTSVTGSGIITVIEFEIENGTTSPDASIVLENLRFDVTGSTGTNYQSVSAGNYLNANVGIQGIILGGVPYTPTFSPLHIGYARKTVESAEVDEVGWGFEDGVCPFVGMFKCGYPNKGGTTGSLVDQAWWGMSTATWATDFPFRRDKEVNADNNSHDPYLIGPTDLVIHVQNIMQGVTVTLPSDLIACSGGSYPYTEKAAWHLVGSQTAVDSNGDTVGIYKTVYPSETSPGSPGSVRLEVATSNQYADPGCDSISKHPLIKVAIGNPSGKSPDGTMQAYLNVVMGPFTTTKAFNNDDGPGGVPRYLDDTEITDAPTRGIIGAATITDPNRAPYFFLNPTQTVLLFPYVSNIDGWDVGMEVSNTGNDSTIFGNTGQSGVLDFYFFPTGGTPFEYTPTISDGRGLVAGPGGTAILKAGGDFADTLNLLLAAAGHAGNFDGYIIVVAHFNFGHGTSLFFDTSGSNTAVPALILGGHCNYQRHQSPKLNTGAPDWPACSSARQGDITQLPEQLDN